jgi:hypothetical protein
MIKVHHNRSSVNPSFTMRYNAKTRQTEILYAGTVVGTVASSSAAYRLVMKLRYAAATRKAVQA